MSKKNLVRFLVIVGFVVLGLISLSGVPKSEMKSENSINLNENTIEESKEIKKYRTWTKANDKPKIMHSDVLALCRAPLPKELDNDIHNNRYINVYVNSIGKTEMLTKKNPEFPVGTIIVKEKLDTPDSKIPALLTVMIKRKKGFNPEVGDWEFMTLNGDATQVTSKGKIQSCQSCHINYEENNFIARDYLPDNIKQKLK
jgi:Cytochrome P460